jgi:predicted nucleotidyltransferase
MAEESIINSVKKYLQLLTQRGIPVQYGVLFGSWAKGRPHEWSDVDVLVVSPHFDGERRREDINLLWRTAAHTDSRIEPIPVGQIQYESDDSSPIIEVARREGLVIALS